MAQWLEQLSRIVTDVGSTPALAVHDFHVKYNLASKIVYVRHVKDQRFWALEKALFKLNWLIDWFIVFLRKNYHDCDSYASDNDAKYRAEKWNLFLKSC